jgi:hypothetical protein
MEGLKISAGMKTQLARRRKRQRQEDGLLQAVAVLQERMEKYEKAQSTLIRALWMANGAP